MKSLMSVHLSVCLSACLSVTLITQQWLISFPWNFFWWNLSISPGNWRSPFFQKKMSWSARGQNVPQKGQFGGFLDIEGKRSIKISWVPSWSKRASCVNDWPKNYFPKKMFWPLFGSNPPFWSILPMAHCNLCTGWRYEGWLDDVFVIINGLCVCHTWRWIIR